MEISEQRRVWWDALSDTWKRIFTAHIYFPEEVKKNYNDEVISEKGTTELQQNSDLERVLNIIRLKYYCEDKTNIVSEIPDFQYHNNLIWVDLQANDIELIDSLTALKNLRELNLSENKIQDISPLRELIEIQELEIAWNKITDVSPLENLIELVNLDISSNQITDVTPLAKLNKLLWLNLSDNSLKDIRPLSELKQLTSLNLTDTGVSSEEISYLKRQLPNTSIYS